MVGCGRGHWDLVIGHSASLALLTQTTKGCVTVFDSVGKLLIVLGVVLALVGGLLLFVGKVPFLGRLPGDIVIRRESWSLYVPLTTSLVISIVLTVLVALFSRR
jgi:hypothetical protein